MNFNICITFFISHFIFLHILKKLFFTYIKRFFKNRIKLNRIALVNLYFNINALTES